MQRVRRSLARNDIQRLRGELAALVPEADVELPEIIRRMRLITRKSQAEYARLCDVAPRVLADIEAGKGNPRMETLERLLRPFGYKIGVVARANRKEFRRTRRLVTRAELNRILTREARKIEGLEDATLRVQYLYREPDEMGSNWSPDVVLNSGRNGLPAGIGPSVAGIVQAARLR